MKMLPDNPSLDHLRQQAKDLHHEMRRATPEATLADAQTSLAEQYGFRAWPDLKAEVDRRREDTRVVDPAIAASVAAAFGLGDVTAPTTATERRWAGQVWSLTTDAGRFAAMELRVELSAVDTQVALLEAAIAAGVLAPAPVRSREGRVVERLDGQAWRVHEWLNHGPSPTKPVAAPVAAAAGRTLGMIHNLEMRASTGVASWLTWRRSEAQWQDLLDKSRRAGAPWASMLEAAIPTFLDVSEIRDDGAGDPLIMSNPFSPASARLAGEGGLVVVDWEHAGATTRPWEVAGMLGWAEGPAGDVNELPARALVDAYVAEAGPVDLDLGSFTTAISAGLNWVASRISIALDGPDAVERDLARKELPGLLSNPPSRIKFEKLLAAVT